MDANPDHDQGRVFNETPSEKLPAGIGFSLKPPSHLSIDTQSGVIRNGSDSPATATRTPDAQTIEEIARSQHFTLRTLPGL